MDLRARMQSRGDVPPLCRVGPGQYSWERYCDGWARSEALWMPEIADHWMQAMRDRVRDFKICAPIGTSAAALALATGEVEFADRGMLNVYAHERSFWAFVQRVGASAKKGRINNIIRAARVASQDRRGSSHSMDHIWDRRPARFQEDSSRPGAGDEIGRSALNIIFLWANELLERAEDWEAVRDLRLFHANAVSFLGADVIYKANFLPPAWDAAAPTLLTWADWLEEKAMKAQADGMRVVARTHAHNDRIGVPAVAAAERIGPAGFAGG